MPVTDGSRTSPTSETISSQQLLRWWARVPTSSISGRTARRVASQRVIPLLNQLKGCLAAGYPFVFGFTVYESFESQQVTNTGHAPMPATSEQVLGGHAVLCVGYEDAHQWFICRNSWGD